MQSLIHRPMAVNKAPAEGGRFYASSARPLSDGQGFSVVRHAPVVAPVRILFCSGRPPHVARLVVAVVVDAINRVGFRWALTHVAQKGLKRQAPCVADLDATPTISVKVSDLGPLAAFFQIAPCSVLWRLTSSCPRAGVSVAQTIWMGALSFCRVTTTGPCFPVNQCARPRMVFFAAVAPTDKMAMWRGRVDTIQNNQAAKPLTCDDRKGSHTAQYTRSVSVFGVVM